MEISVHCMNKLVNSHVQKKEMFKHSILIFGQFVDLSLR